MAIWEKLFNRNKITPAIEEECSHLMLANFSSTALVFDAQGTSWERIRSAKPPSQGIQFDAEDAKKSLLCACALDIQRKYDLSDQERGELVSKVWFRISGSEFVLGLFRSSVDAASIVQYALIQKTRSKMPFDQVYSLLCWTEGIIERNWPKLKGPVAFGYAKKAVMINCESCGLELNSEAISAVLISSPELQNTISQFFINGPNIANRIAACPKCHKPEAIVTLDLRPGKVLPYVLLRSRKGTIYGHR